MLYDFFGCYCWIEERWAEDFIQPFIGIVDLLDLKLAPDIRVKLFGEDHYQSVRHPIDLGDFRSIRAAHATSLEMVGASRCNGSLVMAVDAIPDPADYLASKLSISISPRLLPDRKLSVLDVAQTILTDITPAYGFCTKIDVDLEPDRYLTGEIVNALACTDNWQDMYFSTYTNGGSGADRCMQDQMRDVYDINLLSSRHLDREVGERSLRQWIQSGENGCLGRVRENLWSWEIESGKIPRLRKELISHDVLIGFEKNSVAPN